MVQSGGTWWACPPRLLHSSLISSYGPTRHCPPGQVAQGVFLLLAIRESLVWGLVYLRGFQKHFQSFYRVDSDPPSLVIPVCF